ncbi:MAG: hypothetical protein ACYCS7_06295 [Acidimicrobiales bacterium]
MSELGPGFDLDVAAASLRSDAQDVNILLKLLVRQLSGALGDRLVVERKGGLFKKSDEVKSLRMTMGDETFEAHAEGTSLVCGIGKSSGGIRIRSEHVDADEWLRRTLAALQTEAAHNSVARQALENIVIGESS